MPVMQTSQKSVIAIHFCRYIYVRHFISNVTSGCCIRIQCCFCDPRQTKLHWLTSRLVIYLYWYLTAQALFELTAKLSPLPFPERIALRNLKEPPGNDRNQSRTCACCAVSYCRAVEVVACKKRPTYVAPMYCRG